MPASLLKYWLRDLADPIITSENYNDCIQYAEDPEKAIDIINRLPDTNRRIALYTISFLRVKKRIRFRVEKRSETDVHFIGIHRSCYYQAHFNECQQLGHGVCTQLFKMSF